ncbi:hypothetical protein BDP55DRAFT_34531 [Colletotrichum godetiae]|uniref:Uncharacterized protein n=1 Tax=Colletotrichum godetiae TaxID=1209918 RepID=A0AAJ0A9H9_9PEZI|nr:uncharacterized protein BDP55DRAFT_53344 [Colletotrichum godetiae]XP_060432660.1 uncharacterized protein BDP55DRAFT_34531 [Colletotrichum godetiae]KAK1656980.1 hypothetical protein BDP55DRAFT_53344 [Colletotrichum godetiae]KAK1688965.1 hypothetical protein BDP55DRAFT_34531 [Colletotrichum godetiae]
MMICWIIWTATSAGQILCTRVNQTPYRATTIGLTFAVCTVPYVYCMYSSRAQFDDALRGDSPKLDRMSESHKRWRRSSCWHTDTNRLPRKSSIIYMSTADRTENFYSVVCVLHHEPDEAGD